MAFWRSIEFKVGTFVVGVGGLIAIMSMRVSDDPNFMRRTHDAWFLLPNAGGLVKKSTVRSAGIPIGLIKDIRLHNGKARIEISVNNDVVLTKSAAIEVRAQGILGDSHVEVYPGSPTDPVLADGAEIQNIKDGGSLDKLVGEVTEVTGSLKEVAKSLKEAVSNDGTSKHILGRIVTNIERLTSDLSEITTDNKEKIGEIVDEVHGISSTLNELINDETDEGFRKQWKRAMASLGRLDKTVQNVEEITGKINRGEGTIGKLVNDETTVEELNTAMAGISSMVDSASRTQTGVDFHAEHLTNIKATRSYIGLTIQPGLDRYYQLAIVDDPSGVTDTTHTKITNPDGSTRDEVTTKNTLLNKTKLTAIFAKNFYDFTIKGGLIENTGGFGIDYEFWKKKVKLSLEAFNFGNLNLRTSAHYKIYSGFYLIGGMTDMLDKNSMRSTYLGAGLYLTNDDLKFLLSRSSF